MARPKTRISQSAHAKRLGCSPQAVAKWRKAGAPFVRVGNAWVCSPTRLDRWREENGKDLTGHTPLGFVHNPVPSVGQVAATTQVEAAAAEIQQEVDGLFRGIDNEQLKRHIAEQEFRRRKADADKKELAIAREKGKLVSRAEVDQAEAARIVAVKAGLEALPNKVAARLAHIGATKEIKRAVAQAVRVLLRGYAGGKA